MTVHTIVHVVRHGEVHNPDGVLYGRLPDFHLSELGVKMAERVAESFAGHDIAALVSSPLERAQETMAPIAAAFDLPVHIDERLIETQNYFEGKTFGVGDGSLRRPEHWPKLWNPFRPSWGEPYEAIATRMLAAAAGARDLAPGPRDHLRQPPAADLDDASEDRGQPPLARPAQAAVRAGQHHLDPLRGREDPRAELPRTGCRPGAGEGPQGLHRGCLMPAATS